MKGPGPPVRIPACALTHWAPASGVDVIRLAVEHYLEDFDDLSAAIDRLRDPTDPVLDWDQFRRELLDTD